MTTALLTHADCLGHHTPSGHPERVERLAVILAALAEPEFDALLRLDAPLANDALLTLVHDAAYVARIRASVPVAGTVALDADTHMSPGSLNAALRAAGAGVAAVDLVLAARVRNAFCAVRPPGHHAERSIPMGFCLFGAVAIAAKRALDHHGLDRVAIMDFDVHHGNGTQALLWDEPRIKFISTHQSPLWPGTGDRSECGGAGNNILNVPLPPGTDGPAFRAAMERLVLPALDDFAPDLLLISAGFDAHHADPLANLALGVADFAWATERLCDVADDHAQGRVVSTLEGGYDLDALAASVAAHVSVLMERGE